MLGGNALLTPFLNRCKPVLEGIHVAGGPLFPFNPEGDQPIRFAGSVLGSQRHVCAFFQSSDEEYRVMLPFIYLCGRAIA